MAKNAGRQIVQELGTWLAEQVGCDPKDVLGINLHLHMDDIPTADVRLIVKDGDGFADELRHYTLTRLEEEASDGKQDDI